MLQEEEAEQQQQQEEQAYKCDEKMCGKMVTSCGMKRTSHCALHLRAGAEHMNNTNAHTPLHNPYGIAGVRSSTINQYIYNYIYNQQQLMMFMMFAN